MVFYSFFGVSRRRADADSCRDLTALIEGGDAGPVYTLCAEPRQKRQFLIGKKSLTEGVRPPGAGRSLSYILSNIHTRLRLVTGSLVLVLEVAIETLVWWVGVVSCSVRVQYKT